MYKNFYLLECESFKVGDVSKAFAAYKRDFLLKLRVRVWGMEGLLEYVISKLYLKNK